MQFNDFGQKMIDRAMTNRRMFTVNGLKKPQPWGASYEVVLTNKKQYLESILARLKDDVGPIVDKIETINRKSERKVGFFPMVRVMMPIVETVATSEGREPQALLKELGWSKPFTAWNLYRDVFLHNDEMILASVDDRGIQSGIVLSNPEDAAAADILAKDGRSIDPFRLYRKLVEYIEITITKLTGSEEVEVISHLSYDRCTENPEVQAAISEIVSVHKSKTPADQDEAN